MEEKRLINAIHGAIFRKDVKNIKSVKDFYQDATGDINISNIKLDVVNEHKEVLEWILEHPEYDFNSLYETHYTNQELNRYFKVYYDKLIYMINRHNNKNYIIKPTDFA